MELQKKHGLLINKDLSQYKLWARKHLELQVKLSSLAEETKCYKYWIDDGLNLNKETVFIKYADFLTHVINLGIDKHYIENYEVYFSDTGIFVVYAESQLASGGISVCVIERYGQYSAYFPIADIGACN